MWIVRFALRFPHTYYVLASLILFLGITAIVSMPTDIFPEINIPVVTVIWQYTGLSTPEMEQRVTTYSEYSISSNVNGIKDMEGQTLSGISVQKIFFQPDVSLDLAISEIVAGTNAIRALMPPGIEPPIIVQYNASSVPVLQISLSSTTLNEQQLYDYGIYRLRQLLAPILRAGSTPTARTRNAINRLAELASSSLPGNRNWEAHGKHRGPFRRPAAERRARPAIRRCRAASSISSARAAEEQSRRAAHRPRPGKRAGPSGSRSASQRQNSRCQ
jgi:hypothetical protein